MMTQAERTLVFALAGAVRGLLKDNGPVPELADIIDDLVAQVVDELPDDTPGPDPEVVARLNAGLARVRAAIEAGKTKAR